jgi:hypothetical protein
MASEWYCAAGKYRYVLITDFVARAYLDAFGGNPAGFHPTANVLFIAGRDFFS